MTITAQEAIAARGKLGLSQSFAAEQTGIPRNIMSAFEQQKIVMLDGMQEKLASFFEARGYNFEEPASTGKSDDVAASDEADDAEAKKRRPTDIRIRDGFCVPIGLKLSAVDKLLDEVRRIDNQIEKLLTKKVEGGLIFTETPTRKAKEIHNVLVSLYAKWACAVKRLHGHQSGIAPCLPKVRETWPSNHGELMAQRVHESLVAINPDE